MSKTFDRSTDWILRRRWLSASILLLISLVAIGGYVSPQQLVAWIKKQANYQNVVDPAELPDDTPDRIASRPDVKAISLSGYDAIMVVVSEDFFTPEGTRAIRQVVKRLEGLDYVDRILWMDKVPSLNSFGLNEPLLPRTDAVPQLYAMAQEKARQHPLVNGQLLSEDGKTMLLMIEVDYLFVEEDEVFLSGLREIAEQEVQGFPEIAMDFLVTGKVPVNLVAMQTHEKNRLKYQAIAYGMILLLSMILFRGLVAVVVVAIAPALGIFWTVGMVRYFDLQMNPFNDVVLPVLVALVAFTDGVHLMVQIRTECANGLTPLAAAREGIRKVGLACFLTSLTTAVGFGSLSLADHQLVREFGFCCVFGVILAFIAVLLSIPLACSTWLGKRIHIGYGKGYIDKNISRIGVIVQFVLKHYRWVSWAGIATSLACFAVSLSLRPDERQGDLLPRSSEPALALRQMDQAMGGLEQARVGIDWSKEQAESENHVEELLQVLGQVDQVLTSESLLGHPISLYDLLQALPGDSPVIERASMIDLLPAELKRSFYEPEMRTASAQFRVQDLGIATYGPTFERVNEALDGIVEKHPGFELALSGNPVWRWENIYQIVVDLATSLIAAAVIIFGILSIVYRSLRIGLISLLPNLFPLCVAGVYLVATGQALEIVTVCAFTCCLGIAVDDTIHFLTRYVEEKRETIDESEAIRKAFTAVGTALVMTTLVLVSGFVTVLFSESREHRIFASMGAITVTAALFGDLVFLPAILKRFSPRK